MSADIQDEEVPLDFTMNPTDQERAQPYIDSFRLVINKPVEYRFENGRILTEHGSFGHPDRPLTESEAAMFLIMT